MVIKYKSDYVGIVNSSICLIHCIATPILTGLIGFNKLEGWIEYIFLIISFLACYKSTSYHTSKRFITSIWLCFIVFCLTIIFEEENKLMIYLNYLAGVGIIIAHIWNIQYCKTCNIKKNEN